MFRVLRVLFILSVLAGTFLLFDKNSESITIYFFRDNGHDIPGYLAFIGFIMIGVIIGYIISLKSVFSSSDCLCHLFFSTYPKTSLELASLMMHVSPLRFITDFQKIG